MPKVPKREWQAFERLVARLETVLAPSGARIRCPDDSVWDYDTESHRNVDCTTRMGEGADQGLIAFECRRRGRRSDVRWIEELIGKKMAIRATRMVAVSTNGFGKNIVRKAAKRGIELRSVVAIEADSLASWIALPHIALHSNVISRVDHLAISLEDEQPGDLINVPAVQDGDMMRPDANACFMRIQGLEGLQSLVDLINRTDFRTALPASTPGETTQRRLHVSCGGSVSVPTSRGLVRAKAILIDACVQTISRPGPLVDAVTYSGNRPIMDAAHFDVSAAISGFRLAFHRDAESGVTSIHLIAPPVASKAPSRRAGARVKPPPQSPD